MFCFRQIIIHLEFIKRNEILKGYSYVNQMERIYKILIEKRPALANKKTLFLLRDKARLHTTRITQGRKRGNRWSVLSHSPYLSQLARTDYCLFDECKTL